MKILIVGKINGLRQEEYIEKYKKVENDLTDAGWNAVSPVNLGISVQTPLTEILYKFKSISETIQAIYLLTDWEDSIEARLQKSLASHAILDMYFEQYHSMEYMKNLKLEVI